MHPGNTMTNKEQSMEVIKVYLYSTGKKPKAKCIDVYMPDLDVQRDAKE